MDESRRYLLSKKKTKTVTKEYLSYDSTDMYSGYRRDKHVETGSYTVVVVCGWGESGRWEWLPVDIDFLFRVVKMLQS